MARIVEPTKKEQKEWDKWVKSRPDNVRAIAERFDPWSLYKMKTGQRCTLYSFGEQEDGSVTLSVNITGQFNFTDFDRCVFGVYPDDLEPCDLPASDEMLGTILTNDSDIENYIDEIRPAVLAARGN